MLDKIVKDAGLAVVSQKDSQLVAGLQKVVEEAGFVLLRTFNRDCLLQCVENLQLERDHYRDLCRGLLNPSPDLEEHF